MTKEERLNRRAFYDLRHINSYQWAIWKIILGARQTGKSYSCVEEYIKYYKKYHIPFYWLRLTNTQAKLLLLDNAKNMVDPDLLRKYKLDLFTIGNKVYNITKKDKPDKNNKCKILEKELFCEVYDFSTAHNIKGIQKYDKDALDNPHFRYNIMIDEVNREKGEKNTFDICYNGIEALENLVRSTRNRINIYVLGNLTSDDNCSDFLSMFNFIPEEFGTYTLVRHKKELMQMLQEIKGKKSDEIRAIENKYYSMFKDKNGKKLKKPFGMRAVIHYLKNSEAYEDMRRGSLAQTLYGEHSNFTNETVKDTTIICKNRLIRPNYIIKFGTEQSKWFTCWDNNIITKYNRENVEVINMRPYLNGIFNVETRDNVIATFDTRSFLFRNLIDFKRFQQELRLLKPRGN